MKREMTPFEMCAVLVTFTVCIAVLMLVAGWFIQAVFG